MACEQTGSDYFSVYFILTVWNVLVHLYCVYVNSSMNQITETVEKQKRRRRRKTGDCIIILIMIIILNYSVDRPSRPPRLFVAVFCMWRLTCFAKIFVGMKNDFKIWQDFN